MIAALYVETGGAYYSLEGVEPWDQDRDARRYPGPWPVVAHPPCTTWCRLAGFVQARYGIGRGEDGGCFEAALEAVRRWGGVLEHPAHSKAWEAFGLHRPRRGGWIVADDRGGWTTAVEQGNYGHEAKKPTWLYLHGRRPPELRWGKSGARYLHEVPQHTHDHADRSRTPPEFRDLLLSIARGAPTSRPGAEPGGRIGVPGPQLPASGSE